MRETKEIRIKGQAVHCDRCKCEVAAGTDARDAEHEAWKRGLRSVVIAHWDVETEHETKDRAELCGDCAAQLVRWCKGSAHP